MDLSSLFGQSHVDITSADDVHITIDENSEGVQIWMDVNGVNRARVYRAGNLTITDRRTKPEE